MSRPPYSGFPIPPPNATPYQRPPHFGAGPAGGYRPPTSQPQANYGYGAQNAYGTFNQPTHNRFPTQPPQRVAANSNAYYANANTSQYPMQFSPPASQYAGQPLSYPTSSATTSTFFSPAMSGPPSHFPSYPNASSPTQWNRPQSAGAPQTFPTLPPDRAFEEFAASAMVVQPPGKWSRDRRGSRDRGQPGRPPFNHQQSRQGFSKRKRDDFAPGGGRPFKRDRQDSGPQSFQRGQKPNNKPSAVAPQVPSFGLTFPTPGELPLPPKPPAAAQVVTSKKKNKKKRKKNILGLTPKGEEREESDEEIDEEAQARANMAAGSHPTFGQGPAINFKNKQELLSWLAERKKNYPTQARKIAKASLASFEGAINPKQDESTTQNMALSLGLQGYASDSDSDEEKPRIVSGDGANINMGAKEDPVKIKVKDANTKDGDNDSVSSEEPSSESSLSSDSDAPPREESSRPKAAETPTTSINAEETGQKDKKQKVGNEKTDPALQPYCRNWNTYGTCTWKHCKFKHQQPGVTDPVANERFAIMQQRKHNKTVYQKWVDAEKLQEKNLALQALKFLGAAGVLDEPKEQENKGS